jgi:TRAP-type C4-dicarboxylate transport system substrate-binding protein
MNNKYFKYVPMCLLVLSLLFVFNGNANASPKPESVKLKMATYLPKGSFLNLPMERFVADVTRMSNGTISFDEYYGGSLVGANETVEGIKTGLADVGLVAQCYAPGLLPLAYSNYAFPFAPKSAVTITKAFWQLYDEFPAMREEVKKQNQEILGLVCVSDYALLSRKPIKTLADLKGKKVVQLGGYFAQWTKVSGLTPVSGITAPERYERLRTGVVDASLLCPDWFLTYKEYEIAKHLTLTGLGARIPFYLGINLDTWNKLTPEQKKLLKSVGKNITESYAKMVDDNMNASIKELQKRGVQYYGYFSDQDTKKWASMMPDTVADMCISLEKQHPDIWKISHRFIKLCEEGGHVWPIKLGVKK